MLPISKRNLHITIFQADSTGSIWDLIWSNSIYGKNPYLLYSNVSSRGLIRDNGVDVVRKSRASLAAGIKGRLPSTNPWSTPGPPQSVPQTGSYESRDLHEGPTDRSVRNPTQGPPQPAARQLGIPDPKPGTAFEGPTYRSLPRNHRTRSLGSLGSRIPSPEPLWRVNHDRQVLKKGLGQTRNGITDISDHDLGISIRLPEMKCLNKQSSGY